MRRTSQSHPIRVDWIAQDLGCTFAPGKKTVTLEEDGWDRDLDADLSRLRRVHGVDLLISLVEDHELGLLGIEEMEARATEHGIVVLRSQIKDGGLPSLEQAVALVTRAKAARRDGRVVVFHCRGGLGRAGTMAACVLRTEGMDGERAIQQTREARPGSIENARQEAFVRGFR